MPCRVLKELPNPALCHVIGTALGYAAVCPITPFDAAHALARLLCFCF